MGIWREEIKLVVDNRTGGVLITWLWRYTDRRGAAAEWSTVVVYNRSQPLYHQLHQFSIHHRSYRYQPLLVCLLAHSLWHSVQSPSNCRGYNFNVGGRCCPRLTKPRWLVVALVRHQDSEVYMGPHDSLPLHHLLRRRWHAAAVRHHYNLLLAHFLSYSTRQAAHSQSPVQGKRRLTQNLPILRRCIAAHTFWFT